MKTKTFEKSFEIDIDDFNDPVFILDHLNRFTSETLGGDFTIEVDVEVNYTEAIPETRHDPGMDAQVDLIAIRWKQVDLREHVSDRKLELLREQMRDEAIAHYSGDQDYHYDAWLDTMFESA